MLSDFKTYQKLIKMILQQHKDRQNNGTEQNPKRDPKLHGHTDF